MIMGVMSVFLSGKWYPSFKGSWGPGTPLDKVGFASSSAATGIGGEFGASQILHLQQLNLVMI
jgi:hypothetical protein